MSDAKPAIDGIYIAALELRPQEREIFLDQVCAGYPDIKQRVQQLLKAHEQADSFLEAPAPELHSPAIELNETAASDLESPANDEKSALFAQTEPGRVAQDQGDHIGPYKLLEEIGEGGMGTVWVAQQSEPIKRKVAIKLIKAGMDSRQVLARFEAERQALALMDHPNIARVVDAGMTEQGRPYFAMEYVKGVPLTEYCDHAKLSIKERLELFLPICNAVQHAHQKGIIHRDLKPSNILICQYDGKPVAKVIDFGLAKAMHQSLTDRTLHTRHGMMIGTPLYMSPEQAESNNLDIDTRTDIYSLGVILYELLTGGTPLESAQLKEAVFQEVLRLIKEVEPPKPSMRLSGSESLPSIAAQRSIDPKQLSKSLSGDLDWIVMKALDKERNRRYETANDLARDIDHYLCDEAVEACPPSATYRFKKFIRRNRPQVIAASLVLLALLAGMVGTSIGLLEARRQTEKAREQELEAVKQTGLAREEAAAKEMARSAERLARLDALAEKQSAVEQKAKAEKARDRTRDVLDAMVSEVTGDSLTTQNTISEEQKKFLESVLGYYREFAGENPDDEDSRRRQAEAALRVGMIEYRLGRKKESVTAFRIARDGYMSLAADFPAEPQYRIDLATSLNDLANLFGDLGDTGAAEEQYRLGLAIDEKLAEEFPDVSDYRVSLAANYVNMGLLLARRGDGTAAEDHYRKALAIQEALAVESPAVPGAGLGLAANHANLALLLGGLGRGAEATEQYRKSLAIFEKLAAESPAVPEYRRHLATTYTNLGALFAGSGDGAAADEQYRKGLAILEKLVADFPSVPAYQLHLGASYLNIGNSISRRGDLAESLKLYDRAIDRLQDVHEQEPRDVNVKRALLFSHTGRAEANTQLQKFADAEKDWDRAIELSPPADQPRYHSSRAKSRLSAGMVAEAVAEVAEMASSSTSTAVDLYNFACVCSVASGKSTDTRVEYADRAMEILQKAVKAGWKEAAYMKTDTDLDPLRERDDFKKLLADLEKN